MLVSIKQIKTFNVKRSRILFSHLRKKVYFSIQESDIFDEYRMLLYETMNGVRKLILLRCCERNARREIEMIEESIGALGGCNALEY